MGVCALTKQNEAFFMQISSTQLKMLKVITDGAGVGRKLSSSSPSFK